MAKDYWLFQRKGTTRWIFAWAPDPAQKNKRKQKLLPESIVKRREAETYAEINEDRLKSAPAAHRSASLTVADLVTRWVKLREDDDRFSAATFRDAASHLSKWVTPKLGAKPAASLDVQTVRAWVRWLRESKGRGGKPLAAYTIRNILRSLKWLYADALGEGWIPMSTGNPAREEAVHAELPKTMAPRAGHSQKLRLKEINDGQRLLDCPKVRLQWRARYALDMTSGLRDGELSGLRVRDVDLTANTIRVRQALQLKSRKGFATLGDTKTTESMRTLPLHPAARAALNEWLGDGWELHVGRKPTPDDFVFAKHSGKPWRPKGAVFFRRHLALAGLPVSVEGHALTFHALRRSFANWLRASGVPAEARQVLMGHVAKTAEEKHYSEEDPRALTEFVGRIALVWNRVREASGIVCGAQIPDDKPLHGSPRARRIRRDSEG